MSQLDSLGDTTLWRGMFLEYRDKNLVTVMFPFFGEDIKVDDEFIEGILQFIAAGAEDSYIQMYLSILAYIVDKYDKYINYKNKDADEIISILARMAQDFDYRKVYLREFDHIYSSVVNEYNKIMSLLGRYEEKGYHRPNDLLKFSDEVDQMW